MNSDANKIDLQIIASRDFSEKFKKKEDVDVVSITKIENTLMPLGFEEFVMMVVIVDSLINIFNFIDKYYKDKKQKEKIIIILEDGKQIVVSNIKDVNRLLKDMKD